MKRVVIALAIVLAGLGAASIRVVLEGRAALADGDDLMKRGKPRDAIAAWESAARWYLPFAPHVDEAYARLATTSSSSTSTAAIRIAAARAERRAALATRHVTSPHDPAAANQTIATLAAADPDGASAAGGTPDARVAWHADRLARDPRPAPGPAALAIFGVLCWLSGIAILVGRGIDSAGRLVRRPAVIAAALTVFGFAGWATGLYTA